MKSLGIVLLLIGVLALAYGGISYNRNHTVLEVGSMNITATEHRTIPLPVVLGALVLIGGTALLVVDRRRA
jgi:uncharacterized membrane protein YidH (DUF202 family)